ncbi:hypothetical protein A2Y99_03500 [Candidatus Gottesmanbacteria bacterium RBG_13_37_7]|uniref:BioF2-like acetyltransferase domain-containing protein n=1 Tax=Candidatus Gottesmanbacteria bacterium RBG_13_37_7 TaxID=1798369 RepID=A0A1F5YJ90_9BACT|nr:MAG: hypothetical protein A2Y99_03500 [Candidatus Gottesmanbacteria bacterium RBG_13_37_7]
MHHDIRQSEYFARFMNDLGWQTDKYHENYIYLKKFPLFGYFAKIPRANPPLFLSGIKSYMKKRKIFLLKIAPHIRLSDQAANKTKEEFHTNGFKADMNPFNPTTTILIDLERTEPEIFSGFTQAKRRAVRKAIKNNIIIKECKDIDLFIGIRKKQYAPFPFLIDSETVKIWKNFYPQNASLLLAFSSTSNRALAGILLLFHKLTSYYWFASATVEGKKLFAPTLLVNEALKTAKKRGCKIFDFEGVYDHRFPKAASSWKGFTKFKEGFGGKTVEYMENFTSKILINNHFY